MADDYVIALDQGTTSSRAIVFDREGKPLASDQEEFKQHYPRPGWVEHDPVEIWETQKRTLKSVCSGLEIGPSSIAAIGITNQRETTVVWDRKTGEPVYRAIVWQDRRTADLCEALKATGQEAFFREQTGLVLDPYFSGTKLRWILDNIEGTRERAEAGELAFGTVDSWLVWNLTGGKVHVTDPSNASRTLLFNINGREWDDELLARLEIPRALLPEIVESSGTCATTGNGVPIAGIAGDQQAALFGQACFEKGMVKNTYGTGCFLLKNIGDEPVASSNGLLTTVAWTVRGKTDYALEGSVFIGGAVVQWLRDELKIIESSSEIESLAATVDDSGGVIFVPAFAGLGAPHWSPHARGLVAGVTRGTNRGHLARAALEGIAFQVHEVIAAMESDAGVSISELRVDGGASANELLLGFQADLLQRPVVRPSVRETTALGAAFLAGLGVGVWQDRAEIAAMWAEDARFGPTHGADEMADRIAEWGRAIEAAKVLAG